MDPSTYDRLCDQLASLHAGSLPREEPNPPQEWCRSLYLKILSPHPYPLKILLQILSKLWQTRNPFHISSEPLGIVKARFDNLADLEMVMSQTPWKIHSSDLIILERVQPDKALSEYSFDRAEFWVQLHGIPPNRLTIEFVYTVAARIGIVLPIPKNLEKEWTSFARAKIAVKLSEQLPRKDPFRGSRDELLENMLSVIHAGDAAALAKDAVALPAPCLVPECMLQLARKNKSFLMTIYI